VLGDKYSEKIPRRSPWYQ